MNDIKRRILFITAEYPPITGPGPERMRAFVEGLSRLGHSVTILTSDRPDNHFFSRWLLLREDGTPMAEEDNRSFQKDSGRPQNMMERFFNTVLPTEPRVLLSLPNLTVTALRAFREQSPDVIYVTGAPWASLVGGAFLKNRVGSYLISEFRDPWLQNPIRVWPSYLHYCVERCYERYVVCSSDAIIMNTPTARANILAAHKNISSCQVHAIAHSFDMVVKQPANKKQRKINRLRIAFAGSFYDSTPGHNTGFSTKIFRWLKDSFSFKSEHYREAVSSPRSILEAVRNYNINTEGLRVDIDFIGTDPAYIKKVASELRIFDGYRILPRVPKEKVVPTITGYDFLYLTNPNIESSPFISSKTFDYLASNVNIIAELPSGDQARICERSGLVKVVRPGDQVAFREIFDSFFHDGDAEVKADQAFIDNFHKSQQVKEIHKIVCGLYDPEQKPIISEGYRESGCLIEDV